MQIYHVKCEPFDLACHTVPFFPISPKLFTDELKAETWESPLTLLFLLLSLTCRPSTGKIQELTLWKWSWTCPLLSLLPPLHAQQRWSLFLEQSSDRYSVGSFWSWLKVTLSEAILDHQILSSNPLPPYISYPLLLYFSPVYLSCILLPHQKFSATTAWGYLALCFTIESLCL